MNIPRVILAGLGTLCLSGTLVAQTELIPNDKFSDNGAAWTFKVPLESTATMSVLKDEGEPALCIEVLDKPEGDEKAPDIRVQRLFGEISAGKEYQVSFRAKAAEPVKIIPYIYPVNESARVLWRTELNLDSDWKEYRYTFKGRDTASDCVLGFSQLGRMANKYWIKDITLTEE